MARAVVKRLERVARWGVLGLLALALGGGALLHFRWLYRERHYNQLIERISAQHGLGDDFKYLVKAVVRRESDFDPAAFGKAGEIGLMQVTPGAAEDWARGTRQPHFRVEQLWDPATNLAAGSWYLARAMRRWQHMDDPIPFALAEYNAGLGNVRRWVPADRTPTAAEFITLITYPGVRDYIAAVRGHHEQYRERGRL